MRTPAVPKLRAAVITSSELDDVMIMKWVRRFVLTDGTDDIETCHVCKTNVSYRQTELASACLFDSVPPG